jgi:hypothetical protein
MFKVNTVCKSRVDLEHISIRNYVHPNYETQLMKLPAVNFGPNSTYAKHTF